MNMIRKGQVRWIAKNDIGQAIFARDMLVLSVR